MVTTGHALAAATEAAAPSMTSYLLLLLPLLLIGWMMLTQSRRTKQARAFNQSLQVGDRVVTSSGLFGTIKHLDDSSAYLEVGDGMTVRFARLAITMKQDDITQQQVPGQPQTGPAGEQ